MTSQPVERDPPRFEMSIIPTRQVRMYLDPMDDAPDDEWLIANGEDPAEVVWDEGETDWGITIPHSDQVQIIQPVHPPQIRLRNGRFATREQRTVESMRIIAENQRISERRIKSRQRFTDAAGRVRDGLGRFAKAMRGFQYAGNMARITFPPMTLTTGTTTTSTMPVTWRPGPDGYLHPTATTTGATTMPIANPEVWQTWNNTTATGGNYIINDQVYEQWTVLNDREVRNYEEAARIEQEIQERLQRRREEESRRALARAQKVAGAQERALELLKMILSPEELALWEISGLIHVRGSGGGLYEIDTNRHGVHGNINAVDEHGCRLGNLCVAPQMFEHDPDLGTLGLPLADGWIGQYLTIKNNEEELLRHANWGARRGCQQPGVPILGNRVA